MRGLLRWLVGGVALAAAGAGLWMLVAKWGGGGDAPGLSMLTCPLHGIAYDPVREACPECAKGSTGGAS